MKKDKKNNIQFQQTFPVTSNLKISVTIYKEPKKMSELYSIKTECHLIGLNDKNLLYKSTPGDTLIEGIYFEDSLTKEQIEKELIPFFQKNIHLVKIPNENTKEEKK